MDVLSKLKHSSMRLIGQAERAYEHALIRATDTRKKPRGKLIGEFDSNIERLADMRMDLDALRLVVLNAAETMDLMGNVAGRYAIAQAKIMVPIGVTKIIDECMQMLGGQGLTQHTFLPEAVRSVPPCKAVLSRVFPPVLKTCSGHTPDLFG